MKPLRRFVPLDKALHDRTAFNCGATDLNVFLHSNARRGMDAGVSYTWVLPAVDKLKNGKKRICAWYTLTVAHIERRSLPAAMAKHLPHYPLPVFVLAQLAVDTQCQGKGLGDITLINALKRCASLGQQGKVPAVAVVLDVLNDDAMHFYCRYPDFQPLELSDPNQQRKLFIPMRVVKQL